MKIAVTVTEEDLRRLVHNKLEDTLPAGAMTSFGCNQFEVKMTYGEKEKWRRPHYIQMHFEREIEL